MSIRPRAFQIMLTLLDLLVLLAAVALFASMFFVFSPWWIVLGVSFTTLVAASLVAGIVTAVLIQHFDRTELRLMIGLLLVLAAIVACAWVWRHFAWSNGWLS